MANSVITRCTGGEVLLYRVEPKVNLDGILSSSNKIVMAVS